MKDFWQMVSINFDSCLWAVLLLYYGLRGMLDEGVAKP